MNYTELSQQAKTLMQANRYADALDLLRSSVVDTFLSQELRNLIENEIKQIQNQQQEHFNRLVSTLERDYLNDQVRFTTQREIENIEVQIATLSTIDATRPLTDIQRKVATLRVESQVEWEYRAIKDRVLAAEKSAYNTDTVGSDLPLKEIELELRTRLIPEWQWHEGTNALAGQLLPRLFALLADVQQKRRHLAETIGILTTQAGAINFWVIEESYQRSVKEVGVQVITHRPKMEWVTAMDSEGNPTNKYVATGSLIGIEEWHDAFLDDARSYADEKAAHNFPLAEAALEQGQPLKAQTIASEIVHGNSHLGIGAYFNLSQEWTQKLKLFLVSPALHTSLNLYRLALKLLEDVQMTAVSDLKGAWQKYEQALVLKVDVSAHSTAARDILLSRTRLEIKRFLRESGADLKRVPSVAKQAHATATAWLRLLPDYSADSELALRLDPEKLLEQERQDIERHRTLCVFVGRLELLVSKIAPLQAQLQQLEKEIAMAGFTDADIPLLKSLRT